MHEARYFDKSAFLTLTYRTEKLPENKSVVKRDFQLFMKKLRIELWRRFGVTGTKFFACGEYGEEKGRPHYHCIFLGWDFPDKIPIANNPWAKDPLFVSAFAEEIWENGNVTIGAVTGKSAGYTARYAMKKIGGDEGEKEYRATGRIPPFLLMSKGIGARYCDQFLSDMYPGDKCHTEDGRVTNVPRYYDKRLQALCPQTLEDIKAKRKAYHNTERAQYNNTRERLKVREELFTLKTKRLRRRYEGYRNTDIPKPEAGVKPLKLPEKNNGWIQ